MVHLRYQKSLKKDANTQGYKMVGNFGNGQRTKMIVYEVKLDDFNIKSIYVIDANWWRGNYFLVIDNAIFNSGRSICKKIFDELESVDRGSRDVAFTKRDAEEHFLKNKKSK